MEYYYSRTCDVEIEIISFVINGSVKLTFSYVICGLRCIKTLLLLINCATVRSRFGIFSPVGTFNVDVLSLYRFKYC